MKICVTVDLQINSLHYALSTSIHTQQSINKCTMSQNKASTSTQFKTNIMFFSTPFDQICPFHMNAQDSGKSTEKKYSSQSLGASTVMTHPTQWDILCTSKTNGTFRSRFANVFHIQRLALCRHVHTPPADARHIVGRMRRQYSTQCYQCTRLTAGNIFI